jgi:hypothetical protein
MLLSKKCRGALLLETIRYKIEHTTRHWVSVLILVHDSAVEIIAFYARRTHAND